MRPPASPVQRRGTSCRCRSSGTQRRGFGRTARVWSEAGRCRTRPSSRRPSPRSSTCRASATRARGGLSIDGEFVGHRTGCRRSVRGRELRRAGSPQCSGACGGPEVACAQVRPCAVTAPRLLLELGNVLPVIVDHVTPHLAVERAPAKVLSFAYSDACLGHHRARNVNAYPPRQLPSLHLRGAVVAVERPAEARALPRWSPVLRSACRGGLRDCPP